jgi:hypothetical protein
MVPKIGAISQSAPATNKENTMLRKFAAALVATTLVAGTAFAAEPSGTAGAIPAAPAAAASSVKADTANPAKTIKTVKAIKHAHKRTHTHLARGNAGMKQAHHLTAAKTHQTRISHQANGAGSAKRS